MNQTRIKFLVTLIIRICSGTLLITGSPWLTTPLWGKHNLPFGTLITWFGIIALPLAIYLGVDQFQNPKDTLQVYLSLALKIMLAFAILWVPICFFLAGNFSFSFTEKEAFQGGQTAMQWFWRFTYGIISIPVGLLLIHWVSSILKKWMAK
ncbi:MAG: hypothetical protein KJP00_09620 [Bacteroidia bacterium]|nr:hypothetical protein [Bacteroidia bacterium]